MVIPWTLATQTVEIPSSSDWMGMIEDLEPNSLPQRQEQGSIKLLQSFPSFYRSHNYSNLY